jgi:hypothetical protein
MIPSMPTAVSFFPIALSARRAPPPPTPSATTPLRARRAFALSSGASGRRGWPLACGRFDYEFP